MFRIEEHHPVSCCGCETGHSIAQAFDSEQGQTTGEPVSVAEGVAFGPGTRLGAVSASNDGTLLYEGARIGQYQFTWFDREGKQLGEVGQPDEYTGLRISPDGKRVASTRGGSDGDVWQMEFARGIPTRVTFGRGYDPLWSPDSERIAYGAEAEDHRRICFPAARTALATRNASLNLTTH